MHLFAAVNIDSDRERSRPSVLCFGDVRQTAYQNWLMKDEDTLLWDYYGLHYGASTLQNALQGLFLRDYSML